MKYIIDVPDNAGWIEYYQPSSENSICFHGTAVGISELTPYTEPDRKAIEDAQEKAWELASAIVCPSDCNVGSIQKHCKEIFGVDTWEIRGIFTHNTYQEAKAKYESWKKQKDEIKVGDEVTPRDGTWRGVVVDVDDGDLTIMGSRGISSNGYESKYFSKTGRHFPEVGELLDKMRGEEQ